MEEVEVADGKKARARGREAAENTVGSPELRGGTSGMLGREPAGVAGTRSRTEIEQRKEGQRARSAQRSGSDENSRANQQTAGQRMKQAAAYARVSTEMREHEESLVGQIAALRQGASDREYDLPEEFIFVDKGYSGSKLDLHPQVHPQRQALERGPNGPALGRRRALSRATRLSRHSWI